MRNITLIFFLILITNQKSIGQRYALYSDQHLTFSSTYLNEEIEINLHLPETFNFTSQQTKYPITIVFDSQHERTYPQIINAIDLLTSETQVPESIIIGIPFNVKNRYYFTSNQSKKNDTISGIERMEMFLFKELIPRLKQDYKANDFITLIGHSRTAFLVNYLAFKNSNQVYPSKQVHTCL